MWYRVSVINNSWNVSRDFVTDSFRDSRVRKWDQV